MTEPGRRPCRFQPIIRLLISEGRFIMSCWHCDYRVDLTDTLTATQARVLIAKHNIREW